MEEKDKSEQHSTENSEGQSDEHQSVDKRRSVTLALIGGVAGAGIGLLSSPGTRKKIVSRIDECEVMRTAGRELRRTAQEIVTEQMLLTLKQTASGYWNKAGEQRQEQGSENSEAESSDQYKELKEENKNLNQHLQRIEGKLDTLLASKNNP